MAKRINARLVLELLGRGMSAREIQRTRHIAPQSTAKVRKAAEEKGASREDVADMDEAEVYRLLFPHVAAQEAACIAPGYGYVRSELQKAGAAMQLLYEELKDEAALAGLACKSCTAFCRGCSEFAAARRAANRLEHKPGRVMEADWPGSVMCV